MSAIADLAAGLKANLDAIDGVNTSKYPRSNPSGPIIHLWPSEIPAYHRAMSMGLSEVVFTVELSWPYNDDAGTAAQVYDFLEPTGARSVRQAVEADRTLGGVCDTLQVESSDGLAVSVTQSNEPRLVARWMVRVFVGDTS